MGMSWLTLALLGTPFLGIVDQTLAFSGPGLPVKEAAVLLVPGKTAPGSMAKWALPADCSWLLALATPEDDEPPSAGTRPRSSRDIDRELERRAQRYRPLVEAFYRYDVGLLPGPAGQQVRAAWDRLNDEDAIPAVVAGLNQAVRTGASCPIYAFSAKLRELLGRSNNPEMGAYVLRNLHRQPGMPYYSTVKSVEQAALNQLMRTKSRAYGRQSLLNRMRAASERDVVGLPTLLFEPVADSGDGARDSVPNGSSEDEVPTSTLVSRLASGRASPQELAELEERATDGRAAELLQEADRLAVIANASGLPRSHRITAIRILGRLRVRDAVPALIDVVEKEQGQLRTEATMALIRTTRKLFGPAPGASPEEVRESVRRWRSWWQDEGKAAQGND